MIGLTTLNFCILLLALPAKFAVDVTICLFHALLYCRPIAVILIFELQEERAPGHAASLAFHSTGTADMSTALKIHVTSVQCAHTHTVHLYS